MSKAIDFDHGIGRKEIQGIRRRFQALHRERLKRIEAELRPSQRIYVQLLPLLFHINHPMLPGFVSSDAPAGLPDYNPSQTEIRRARKLSRSFEYKKKAKRRFDLTGIYLMGSIGSIAHTEGSDLDIWLCHDPKLDSESLENLQQKAHRVEQWAADLGLEAHIFLINVDIFKQGKRDSLSQESSGSTQPHLLLEEFYRTAVFLAGRYPLWWLIPPDQESNYRQYAEMLVKKRFIDPLDFIDFGGLETLPADEFFGSAHWQLYKGIESPYKSILKLLLIEAYARDYPDIRWLSQEAKRHIYAGDADADLLDPYILMFRRVESYLKQNHSAERLDLARRCFYFKTELPLSQAHGRQKESWKRLLLRQMADQWGWPEGKLKVLDERARWKIDRVLQERSRLVNELSNSYRLLTDFARTFGASSKIDSKELSLLGRKLYTALEKRPGKIDSINPGISRNLLEESVSLHYTTSGGGNGWFLYLGDINTEKAQIASPIKGTTSLVEMLGWCHINQIIDGNTLVHIYPEEAPVSLKEVQEIIRTLHQEVHLGHLSGVPIKQLSAPPFAHNFCLFINVGLDPMAELSKRGRQLTTERNDVLSFGGSHASLISSIDQLTGTSWGEQLIIHYQGHQGILDSLCNYLRMTIIANRRRKPTAVTAHCFSSIRARTITLRIEQLFEDVVQAFIRQGPSCRYLLQVGNHFDLIQRSDGGIGYFSIENFEELTEVLGEDDTLFRPLVIDRMILNDTPLPVIYEINQPDLIQVFYQQARGHVHLYILDERGALFHQLLTDVDEHYLLVQQQRFLIGLMLMHNMVNEGKDHQIMLNTPEFYRLEQDREGQFIAEPRTPPRHSLPDNYMELRLVSESLDLHQSRHYLMCGDREFSSLVHGENLYHAVAEYVLSRRSHHQAYPIYLTGLEISGMTTGGGWSTIKLLKFKKRLEARLNHALQLIVRR